MPRVRHMDNSARHADEVRWIAPPSLPMREHAHVLNAGGTSSDPNGKAEGGPWPFLLSYRNDGRVTVNRARSTTPYQNATTVGDALI
jgi:hypothetical protein